MSPDAALKLIRRDCKDILAIQDPSTLVARCRKVSDIIMATTHYLKKLDQRHSTLDSYKWYFIDREKVEPDRVETDVFRARPVIPNVSAVSFSADYGDVYLYEVVVHDVKGNPTTFPLRHEVEQNYPHEEICYLYFPTTLERVILKYEVKRYRSRVPRVTVFAGVAREQEYLKQALYYLHRARRETDQAMRNPAAAAPHIEAAREYLNRAAERLIRFRAKWR